MTTAKIAADASGGAQHADTTTPVFIRGPALRKRWGLGNSAFYERLKRGQIPPAIFPFGPGAPYWLMRDVIAFEERAAATKPTPGV